MPITPTKLQIIRRDTGGLKMIGVIRSQGNPEDYLTPQIGSFYIDNVSIIGQGTIVDPLRFTGVPNTLTGPIDTNPSFTNQSNAKEIFWDQEDGVWIDGATLAPSNPDFTANVYPDNLVVAVYPDVADTTGTHQIYRASARGDERDVSGFRLNYTGPLWIVSGSGSSSDILGVIENPEGVTSDA